MADSSFYSGGLKFTCRQCSKCCGGSPGFVYLSRRDLFALCDFFNLSVSGFTEKYCRWADYYGGTTVLALKEEKDFYCVLWSADSGCTAYSARPVQCSTYPFWTWMINDKASWDECARDCPGMNSGKLWSAETVSEESRRYSENEPVYKEEVLELIRAEKNEYAECK